MQALIYVALDLGDSLPHYHSLHYTALLDCRLRSVVAVLGANAVRLTDSQLTLFSAWDESIQPVFGFRSNA
jgi:hypothetical protein